MYRCNSNNTDRNQPSENNPVIGLAFHVTVPSSDDSLLGKFSSDRKGSIRSNIGRERMSCKKQSDYLISQNHL